MILLILLILFIFFICLCVGLYFYYKSKSSGGSSVNGILAQPMSYYQGITDPNQAFNIIQTIDNTPVDTIRSLPLTQQLFLIKIMQTLNNNFSNDQTYKSLITKGSKNMTPAQKLTGNYLFNLLKQQANS